MRALAAVCLAGAGGFGWMWTLVDDGATGLDRQAFTAVATESGSFLARAAHPLAIIGPVVTGALVLVVIAWLARRRRWLAATAVSTAGWASERRETRPPGARSDQDAALAYGPTRWTRPMIDPGATGPQ